MIFFFSYNKKVGEDSFLKKFLPQNLKNEKEVIYMAAKKKVAKKVVKKVAKKPVKKVVKKVAKKKK
jgi:hypothetical protein